MREVPSPFELTDRMKTAPFVCGDPAIEGKSHSRDMVLHGQLTVPMRVPAIVMWFDATMGFYTGALRPIVPGRTFPSCTSFRLPEIPISQDIHGKGVQDWGKEFRTGLHNSTRERQWCRQWTYFSGHAIQLRQVPENRMTHPDYCVPVWPMPYLVLEPGR
jgi:hypothetical protein